MPSTESFTSTCAVVSSATATLGVVVGYAQYDNQGFYVKIDHKGVYVTKAASFGSAQSALTFPITRDAATQLASTLLRVAG